MKRLFLITWQSKTPLHLVFSHSANIWVWLRARCQKQVYTAHRCDLTFLCNVLLLQVFFLSICFDVGGIAFKVQLKMNEKKNRNVVCTMNIKLRVRVILYYLSIESARVVWSFRREKPFRTRHFSLCFSPFAPSLWLCLCEWYCFARKSFCWRIVRIAGIV